MLITLYHHRVWSARLPLFVQSKVIALSHKSLSPARMSNLLLAIFVGLLLRVVYILRIFDACDSPFYRFFAFHRFLRVFPVFHLCSMEQCQSQFLWHLLQKMFSCSTHCVHANTRGFPFTSFPEGCKPHAGGCVESTPRPCFVVLVASNVRVTGIMCYVLCTNVCDSLLEKNHENLSQEGCSCWVLYRNASLESDRRT